jgi:hypothetical protein
VRLSNKITWSYLESLQKRRGQNQAGKIRKKLGGEIEVVFVEVGAAKNWREKAHGAEG